MFCYPLSSVNHYQYSYSFDITFPLLRYLPLFSSSTSFLLHHTLFLFSHVIFVFLFFFYFSSLFLLVHSSCYPLLYIFFFVLLFLILFFTFYLFFFCLFLPSIVEKIPATSGSQATAYRRHIRGRIHVTFRPFRVVLVTVVEINSWCYRPCLSHRWHP